jgi:hypothetical protein
MIITRKHARQLIKQGKATHDGTLKPDQQGRVYAILTRHDQHRTDHYRID